MDFNFEVDEAAVASAVLRAWASADLDFELDEDALEALEAGVVPVDVFFVLRGAGAL